MVPHAMAMLLLSPAMAPPGDQWPHVSPSSAHSTHLWLRLSLSVIPDPGSNQPQSQLNSQPEGPWIPSSEIQKFKVWMSSKKTVLYRKVSLKVKSFLSSECVFSSDVAVIAAPGHHDPGLAPDRRRPLGGRGEAPQPRQQPQHRHQGERNNLQISGWVLLWGISFLSRLEFPRSLLTSLNNKSLNQLFFLNRLQIR